MSSNFVMLVLKTNIYKKSGTVTILMEFILNIQCPIFNVQYSMFKLRSIGTAKKKI